MLSMPDAVLFDMDGTLFDTERLGMSAWMQVAKKLNLNLNPDLLYEGIGRPTEHLARLIKANIDNSLDTSALVRFYDAELDGIIEKNGVPLKRGVYQFIDFLSRHDVLRAIATSSDSSRTRRLLLATDLYDSFDSLITVDMVKNGKPFPDLYLKACEELDVVPSKALVVEDSSAGIIAAAKAGIPAVWIPDLEPLSASAQIYKPTRMDSFEELRRVLASSLVTQL